MGGDFNLEISTIWSFPDRGSWSTHKRDYPGNWSPYVPRNIILRYSKENEVVLDQFVGSGTTIIEAKTLYRRAIGYDVNDNALNIARERVDAVEGSSHIILERRDARNLFELEDKSIDLTCTHPPYANIIKYSNNIKQDISLLEIDDF